MTPRTRKLLQRGLLLLGLIALTFWLSPYAPAPLPGVGILGEDIESWGAIYESKEGIRQFLLSLGPYATAVFVLLQAAQVVLSPIPGELTGIVGGYIYGTTVGFLLSTAGLTLGSWLVFELARILGRPFVERIVSKKMRRRFHFLSEDSGAVVCFVLFAFPGFPKDALSYLLGVSRMPFGTFMFVSTIGRMPGTYVLSLQGATLRNEDYYTAGALAVLCGFLLLLAYLFRGRLFNWLGRSRRAAAGHEHSRS